MVFGPACDGLPFPTFGRNNETADAGILNEKVTALSHFFEERAERSGGVTGNNACGSWKKVKPIGKTDNEGVIANDNDAVPTIFVFNKSFHGFLGDAVSGPRHFIKKFVIFFARMVFVAGSPVFGEHAPSAAFGFFIFGFFGDVSELSFNMIEGPTCAKRQRDVFGEVQQGLAKTVRNDPSTKRREGAVDVESDRFVAFLKGEAGGFFFGGREEVHDENCTGKRALNRSLVLSMLSIFRLNWLA